ncbi:MULTISPECIES: hypothetical protein [Streptomyces]|uniref:Uncharacterized protein n=1 Tax=Streptomyces prasinus TaxID=67345 RepID=A0ABX6B4N3_9ACTN|nr:MULTISPECIES: hypothetical protein [Streptomyces]OBQ53697.1 hypothetical protein A4U61_06010 [Streptomyces sp. H-KF8]QEV09069.1 hypothetical protein CP972_28715 [Streptomyces prasinus]
MADPTEPPHIVVHAPALDGSRRVTSGDETLGVASHLDDVGEILRLADHGGTSLLELIEEFGGTTDIEEADLIEWQGGGPEDWPGLSKEHHEA